MWFLQTRLLRGGKEAFCRGSEWGHAGAVLKRLHTHDLSFFKLARKGTGGVRKGKDGERNS